MFSFTFLLGLAAVALGAAGSHLLPQDMLPLWQTAVSYQFWHVLAALICLVASRQAGLQRLLWSVPFFWLGMIFFSGSLYCKALQIDWWPVQLAPIGGSLLMLGWLIAALVTLLASKK